MPQQKKPPNSMRVLKRKTEKTDKSFEKMINYMTKRFFCFQKRQGQKQSKNLNSQLVFNMLSIDIFIQLAILLFGNLGFKIDIQAINRAKLIGGEFTIDF